MLRGTGIALGAKIHQGLRLQVRAKKTGDSLYLSDLFPLPGFIFRGAVTFLPFDRLACETEQKRREKRAFGLSSPHIRA
jgi:hypothetical protein